MPHHVTTAADTEVENCLRRGRSFALIAGAGSGKTTSLVNALSQIREQHGATLRKNEQRIACITYTNRAVEVIQDRLGIDQLYRISTLHGFLWDEIKRFQRDIREALQQGRIPALIAKAKENDNGKETKKAIKAREQVSRLEAALANVQLVENFSYDDSQFSDYSKGKLSHDDVIEISGFLMEKRPLFRGLLGSRYPYIFVDEAQDTFQPILHGLNLTCAGDGLPIVGYFGDPWQQIYEGRAGEFKPPPGGQPITKVENFRSATEVITLLNAFREDVQQVAAGDNKAIKGSVAICLVQALAPEGPGKRYSEDQLDKVLKTFDSTLDAWGWKDRDDVIRLFLVRQMIARRLGFYKLNQLFNGPYASQQAKDDYQDGMHHLLKPLVQVICPLIAAYNSKNDRAVINILRENCPFYSTAGPNASKSLKEVIGFSSEHLRQLATLWNDGTIRDVYNFCRKKNLLKLSDRLVEHLDRGPRQEEYNSEQYSEEKGDWLADGFFVMPTSELQNYTEFVMEHTPYSTQHGVKGEEYGDVLVVYDDVEAAWNNYNFTKLLTPQTSGTPTDGQHERSRKLAYVSFSRAEQNLRIILFTPDPESAKTELVENGLFREDQISIS